MNAVAVVCVRPGAMAGPLGLMMFFMTISVLTFAKDTTGSWIGLAIAAAWGVFAVALWEKRIEVYMDGVQLRSLFHPPQRIPFATLKCIALERSTSYNGHTPITLLVLHFHSAYGLAPKEINVTNMPLAGIRQVLEAVARRAHRLELNHLAELVRSGQKTSI